MLTFLLVVQAIVAVMLVGVILMQQSEGGGLGMGGSPTGLMSARGAADFLTRATAVLAIVFIGLSILHAVLATRTGTGVSTIDTSLARPQAPVAPAQTPPLAGQPAAPTSSPVPLTVPTPNAAAAPTVPLATARPKVEATPERTPRPAPRTATPTVAAPPAIAPTVTPSIPKAATPAPTPAQGPPANTN